MRINWRTHEKRECSEQKWMRRYNCGENKMNIRKKIVMMKKRREKNLALNLKDKWIIKILYESRKIVENEGANIEKPITENKKLSELKNEMNKTKSTIMKR